MKATGIHDDTVHLLTGQKRLKDNYKYPDMLPKVNKAVITGTVEVIKKSHCTLKCCESTSCMHYKEGNNGPDLW